MSWSTGKVSVVELDNKIAEATSESIPNGELELSIALEITDVIRSKKIPAKQCMRSLKKRLTLIHTNPNLIKSTLKLIDLCVKNSGYHFLVEIATKEFMDYLVDFILLVHYNVNQRNIKNNEAKLSVGNLILSLIKEWSIIFGNQLQLNYVEKVYNDLVNQGFTFPELNNIQQLNTTFVDSEVPPDWIDSDSCMICYTPFSMLNRKHHCRACGGVFCQTHSGNNIPLVQLGIMEAVRVCDNCLAKQKVKSNNRSISGTNYDVPVSASVVEDEDEQLRRAIELSLQDSSIPSAPRHEPFQPPPPTQDVDEEDEEMKAAIAASLKEYETEKAAKQQFQQQQQQQQQVQSRPSFTPSQPELTPSQPESDLYNFSIPSSQPHYSQPSIQQQQQQQLSQQQTPQQAQEDLSQAEEEQINLFITLMNSVRNDPKKQANIMYDQDLNELYSKIIRLKPKVNKSLRNSIEKYEIFLQLNNKISTITRLYDQFLENKLNLAYGNHYITPQQNTGYPNFETQQGAGYQANEYSRYEQVQTQGTGYQQPQGTGYQQEQRTGGYVQPQGTGYEQPQTTGEYAQPSESYQQTEKPYPETDPVTEPVNTKPNFYPTFPQESYSMDSITKPISPLEQVPQQLPSEPKFEESVPKFSYSQYPPEEPVQQEKPTPSYPTSDNYLPSESDKSEYVTVSLPHYPPPEDLANELPVQSYIRRAESSIPDNAIEDANVKFPSLENVEEEYYKQSKLPNLPNLPQFEEDKEVKNGKKFVSEPEPLIDL